jgi:hypothetical protein
MIPCEQVVLKAQDYMLNPQSSNAIAPKPCAHGIYGRATVLEFSYILSSSRLFIMNALSASRSRLLCWLFFALDTLHERGRYS